MKYFEKIPGDKVYLSPINKDDAETYTKWLNNASVTDKLGFTWQQIGVEKETEVLESMIKEGHNFAIIRREGNELIGNTGFMEIDQIHRTAQIGIFIGEESDRGKGYGSEAMRLLLKFGFETLNLNNIMLRVFDFNKNAIACYEKLGFKKIGERRKAYFVRGKYHNAIYMDILADEFVEK